ncbi:MAG: flagellar biosynthetic protein FliR [Pseudomonadota bacterium]
MPEEAVRVLAAWLAVAPALVIAAAGVFIRVGAMMALLPGLGETAVPMRVRLGLTVAITALTLPAVAPAVVPPLTAALDRGEHLALTMAGLVTAEAAAGLLIGLAFRMTIFALQIAGTVASQNISLSHLFGNPATPEPEPSMASLLALGGTAIALIAGLHIEVVAAIVRLYGILPFAGWPPPGEAAAWTTARVGETFALGVGLAMPFVIVGFAYNVVLGALSRAMPQLLLTLVGVPLLVGLGLGTLWFSIPEIYARWGEALVRVLVDPLGGLGDPPPPVALP